MGRGRARTALVGVVVLLALAVAGCGAESHPNEPRPAAPTRVSITLTPKGVTVTPAKVAFGPERTQQIPQNQNHPQPPIKSDKPLNVIFVIANQTAHDTNLQIHGDPKDVNSPSIPATSPGTYQTELPTGSYYVTAEGVPASRTKLLTVGPYRASSENDVLLP
jgi:hypothetical protein